MVLIDKVLGKSMNLSNRGVLKDRVPGKAVNLSNRGVLKDRVPGKAVNLSNRIVLLDKVSEKVENQSNRLVLLDKIPRKAAILSNGLSSNTSMKEKGGCYMNEKELKLILTQFKENNFQRLETIDVGTLTNAILHHIGSTDPVLRDHLIYPSLTNLIINNHYPRPELNRIMKVCLDETHLFYKINEADEDAVFTRAFSSLIIAVLLHVNRQSSFLTDDEIDDIAVKLMEYVNKEVDVRGFVEEKGWAHSIAHIADALDELVNQPEISTARLEEIAQAIIMKMDFEKEHYLFEEDERMVTTMVSLLQKDMNQHYIKEKISEVTSELKQNFIDGNKRHFIRRANFKQFLRSLFLHLEVINKHEELRTYLRQELISINQPYYNI
jgi:hypothetical protein